jgi:hypothetical protein
MIRLRRIVFERWYVCPGSRAGASTAALGGLRLKGGLMPLLELELIRLSDLDLVRRIYEGASDFIENDEKREQMCLILDEALERWAPEAEWLFSVGLLAQSTRDPDHLLDEVKVARGDRQQREGARILLRELPEGEGGRA